MNLTVDSSVIMAVLLEEPSKELLIELTKGADLLAPPSVTWEIGNAFSSLLRRGKVTLSQALTALAVYDEIPIRIGQIDLPTALRLAAGHGIYAYDAYVVECARKYRTPLLSMDKGQCQVAEAEGIDVMEVMS
jgi:predicted nucleic acid-binding protein